MKTRGSDVCVNDLPADVWKELVDKLIAKGEPGMLDMTTIRPTGPAIEPSNCENDSLPPSYDEYYRIRYDEAVRIGEVWRLNDERNKLIEAAKRSVKGDE